VACIDTEGKELYLMGDTNCDLKVNDNYYNYYNNNSITLLRINAIYGLTQNIKVKTTETTSSPIDHIITNSPDKITFSGVLHLGISDHSLMFDYRKLLFPIGIFDTLSKVASIVISSDGTPLEEVHSFLYLGKVINKNLTWEDHLYALRCTHADHSLAGSVEYVN
jgi:hypothetical protein